MRRSLIIIIALVAGLWAESASAGTGSVLPTEVTYDFAFTWTEDSPVGPLNEQIGGISVRACSGGRVGVIAGSTGTVALHSIYNWNDPIGPETLLMTLDGPVDVAGFAFSTFNRYLKLEILTQGAGTVRGHCSNAFGSANGATGWSGLVADLPSEGSEGVFYQITDGTTPSTCSLGTGDPATGNDVFCIWNGSGYQPGGVAATGLTNPLVGSLDASGNDIVNPGLVDGRDLERLPVPVTTSVQDAISEACSEVGELSRQCSDVLLPEGITSVTQTIHISGDGLPPSVVTSEGQWSLRIIGQGGTYFQVPKPPGAGAPRCASTLRWDGPANQPMIQVHGGRDVLIEGVCLDGASGANGPSDLVLVTSTNADSEISQGIRLREVDMFAFKDAYDDPQVATHCVRLAPSDYSGDPPYATDAQIDDFVIQDSTLSCPRGFLGANGNTNGVRIENSRFLYSEYGVWAEDSDIAVVGGYSNTWASLPLDQPGEAAACNQAEAFFKIGSTSDAQPKVGLISHHSNEADCGIGVDTVDAAIAGDTRNSTMRIESSQITVGGNGQRKIIDYDHWGTLTIDDTLLGSRNSEVFEDGVITAEPPSGDWLRLLVRGPFIDDFDNGTFRIVTNENVDRGRCAEREVPIPGTDARACMASFVNSSDLGAVLEIVVDPPRLDGTNPMIGDDIAASILACLDPSSVLNIDTNGGPAPGCRIRVVAGSYTESEASFWNMGDVDQVSRAGVYIDIFGSEVFADVPDFDLLGATINPDTRGACNWANRGEWVQITDGTNLDDSTIGGSISDHGNFCNGNSWEAGWPMWTLGGPAAETIQSVTVELPSLVFDTNNADQRGIRHTLLRLSGDAGGVAPHDDGGFHQVRLLGGSIRGTTDLNQLGIDVGGPLGGSGGPQAANAAEGRAEGVEIASLDCDFVSDTGFGVWIRNASDVHLNVPHFEHGCRLAIGEDQANEERPDGVVITAPHIGGSDAGPSVVFTSGAANCVGCEGFGDKDAADAGTLFQLGGQVAPGVIFNSDGAHWKGRSENDGFVLVYNVRNWTQEGGAVTLADGHTGAIPMFFTLGGTQEKIHFTGFTLDGPGDFLTNIPRSPEVCIHPNRGVCTQPWGEFHAAYYADGSTTGGIQEAIDDCKANLGGKVVFPPGVTTIDANGRTSPIIDATGVDAGNGQLMGVCTLTGFGTGGRINNNGASGVGASTFRVDNFEDMTPTDGLRVGIQVEGQGVEISDMALRITGDETLTRNDVLVNLVASDRAGLRNLHLRNRAGLYGTAIRMEDSQKSSLLDIMQENMGTGLYVANGTNTNNATTVTNSAFRGNGDDGIYLEGDGASATSGCNDFFIFGGTLEGNGLRSITGSGIEWDSDSHCRVSVYATHFENSRCSDTDPVDTFCDADGATDYLLTGANIRLGDSSGVIRMFGGRLGGNNYHDVIQTSAPSNGRAFPVAFYNVDFTNESPNTVGKIVAIDPLYDPADGQDFGSIRFVSAMGPRQFTETGTTSIPDAWDLWDSSLTFCENASGCDVSLPPAVEGMTACWQDKNGGGVVTLDPDGTETIELGGAVLPAGNAIDSAGDRGDRMCLYAHADGEWTAMGGSGAWIDGGAD